jgi:hypothetical protein
MKKLLMALVLLAATNAVAQQVIFKVVDSATKKPLPYATISFHHQKDILYADSSGQFAIEKDSVFVTDTISIQYLGYRKLLVTTTALGDTNILELVQAPQELKPVVVTNCRSFKNYVVNKRIGKINNYLGPGPETKIIIIGRYFNNEGKHGYVKELEFYSGSFNKEANVPVRLHWYDWIEEHQMPGQDITTSSIIVYPYQQGWNKFALPKNSLYFSRSGVVLGLEFIYPVEFVQQYTNLVNYDDKSNWLKDMKHRWSLGMQTVTDASQTGFYAVNNGVVQKYNLRKRNSYVKPAIRFTINSCEDR